MMMDEQVEWYGIDGEWHPAVVVGPVAGDDEKVLIELEAGALIVAKRDALRASVPISSQPLEYRVSDQPIELENHVRIGVKAWDHAEPALRSGRWSSSFAVMWVEVDGVRVPGMVISAQPRIGAYDDGFQSVDIRLAVSKVETVRWDEGSPE